MRKTISSALLVGLLMAVPNIAWSDVSKHLHGTLVFGVGSTLRQAKLDGMNQVEVRDLHHAIVKGLSKIDNERFIFGELERSGAVLKVFNRLSRQVTFVRSGSFPLYVPNHKKIVFYDVIPNERRTQLLVADLDNPKGSTKTIYEGSFGFLRRVVQVDEDNIVFLTLGGPTTPVAKFNVKTNEYSDLPLKGCVPQLWVSAHSQLLCYDVSTKDYALAGLNGEKKKIENWPDGANPLLYLEDLDAVFVLFEAGVYHGVSIVDLKGKKLVPEPLIWNTPISPGGTELFAD